MKRFATALFAAALAAGVSPARADANHSDKVWMVLETPHFLVHYYAGEARTARRVAAAAEEVLPSIARDFGVSLSPAGPHPFTKVPVVLDQDSFFNGEAEPVKDRIYLDPMLASSSVIGTRRFIAHELTHVINFRALDHDGELSKLSNVGVLPRWFLEGLAQYEGEYWYATNDRMLRLHTLDNTLLTNSERDNFPMLGNEAGAAGYNEGYSLTRYIFDTYGRDKIAKLMKVLRDGQENSLDLAIAKVTGQNMDAIRAAWLNSLRVKYRLETLDVAAEVPASHVVVPSRDRDVNVRPQLSPDGKQLAYLTSRHEDSFLYLRGHVMGFLSLDIADPDGHHGHLLPVARGRISTFTWSPDGKQLVVSAACDDKADDPTFDLFVTAVTGGQARRLTHIGGATDPAWRPGTDEVAFVQTVDSRARIKMVDVRTGAITDLGVELGDRQVSGLSWRPDGKLLVASSYLPGNGGKLVLIDPADDTLTPLTDGPPRVADSDPSWTPDGKAIVFSSTRDGMENLYELTLPRASARLYKLTDVYCGARSPSLIDGGKTVLWSGFVSTGSEIREAAIHPKESVAYQEPHALTLFLGGAKVAGPGAPAPVDAHWSEHPYVPKMTPDIVMPEVTSDERGQQVGMAALYSDILGKQQLGLDVRFGLMSQRFSYQASYTNQLMPHTWQLSVFDQPTIGIPDQIVPTDLDGSLYWERQRGISGALQLGQFTLSSTFSYLDALTQPAEPGLRIREGRLDSLSLGWSEQHVQPTFDEDINPSAGYAVAANYTISDHLIGSDFDFSNTSLLYERFIPIIPDWRHNLTLSAAVGINQGDAPPMFIGGAMGGGSLTALRGYDAGAFAGNRMVYGGAEYTLPIRTRLDYALGPLYFDKLYASAFVEAGDAWQGGAAPTFHSSVGGELRLRLALGGSQVVVLHLGVAHPMDGAPMDWFPYISF
ncbi:MAG: PD40 domain-containing protein [Cyanobacteria bacterium REEB65]|nr:PD40 domain-containing protein [Cyanobacteria bacterium REEB65]